MAQNFDFWSNKTPFSIFVDPAHYLGFVGNRIHRYIDDRTEDLDDPNGDIVAPYINRLRNVCSFYTYASDYGDINSNGSYATGWTGFVESHARISPENRRNIMLNVQEYWTLDALYSPNYYATNINPNSIDGVTFGYGPDTAYYDTGNATGITFAAVPPSWKNDPQIINEFSRQSAMGVPYLSGGLTPGSAGATMGTFKSVAKRFYNDMAQYLKDRGTECVIHYSDFGTPQISSGLVPKIGLRSINATGDRSWWRRSFWYPDLYDSINYSKDKGILRDLADASLSADMYGGSVYNWFPNIEPFEGSTSRIGRWHTGIDRLYYTGPGTSAQASTDFNMGDLTYWVSKGPAALMHEYYKYTDELATSQTIDAYRKGLAMVVQLDLPVISAANKIGGGEFAATKFGHMKDLLVAADTDIFGAFGATDANVPYMRKPDQIWVWSSNWYNNKLLFESGTGNAGDAVALFGNDELTARFGIYTARSQVEKLIFKRPLLSEEEGELLAQTNGYFESPTTEQQEDRLQWLEQNTLPNVYWDARTGVQEGVSNNIRFWSAATGNCLPAPCVFDRTSPIAAFLNMNNDIFKNDVRVAYKKWICETHTSAIERVHAKLTDIGFTPALQKKRPSLFVDPNIQLGWTWYEEGYSGATANQFRDRMLRVATPYTYVSSRLGLFGPLDETYLPQQRYFDATYGLSSNTEIQASNQPGGPNLNYQIVPNGYQGGHYLPPINSRAVMFNSERPWLELFAERLKDNYCCNKIPQNDPDVIAEFARQASMGPSVVPYLFPDGHPEGGLTPGSAQTNLGVVRRVGEKQWNDLSVYALGNGDGSYSSSPKARYVIHYAGAPADANNGVPRSGIRRIPNTTKRSYWERNEFLFDFDDIYDGGETSFDRTNSLYGSQTMASETAVSFYNTYPQSQEWAVGATFWFTDFDAGNRKNPEGTALSSDYSFADLLYWQTKEHASIIGQYNHALAEYNITNQTAPEKFAAIVTPMWSYEGGEITEILWNAWSGSRKDPRLAAAMDAASLFSRRDQDNPITKSPDSVWVWDATHYYWIDIPTKSTYTPENSQSSPGNHPTEWPGYSTYLSTNDPKVLNAGVIGQTMFARNYLEKMLFGRPEYPTALLQLIESDGISSGGIDGVSVNQARGDIQARTGKWIFDNSLTDAWWVTNPYYIHAENRVWYDPIGGSQLPSPCVLDQDSPLAPWLNFNSEIRTTDVIEAMRNYVSDYSCRYVESFKDQIDRYFAS